MENCGTPCDEPLCLVKSTDKGTTWQNFTQGLPNPIRRLEGLTVAPDGTSPLGLRRREWRRVSEQGPRRIVGQGAGLPE